MYVSRTALQGVRWPAALTLEWSTVYLSRRAEVIEERSA